MHNFELYTYVRPFPVIIPNNILCSWSAEVMVNTLQGLLLLLLIENVLSSSNESGKFVASVNLTFVE